MAKPITDTYELVRIDTAYNSGTGTAYTGGEFITITNGEAAKCAYNGIPSHVIPEGVSITAAQSITAAYKDIGAIDVTNGLFECKIVDDNSDLFYQAMTGGSTTTIADTTNRSESNDYFNYGYVYHHGLKQYRRVSDFTQSGGVITIARPFTDPDGTDHTNAAGEYYSITTIYPGLTTVEVYDGSNPSAQAYKAVYAEAKDETTWVGKLEAMTVPCLERNRERVVVRARSET